MDSDIRKLHDFINRWEPSTLNEQEGAQSHFLELCDVVGQPHPDKPGEYQFEMRVEKSGGGTGRADVWKKGCFAWEYKSPGEDLNRAFNQLKQYAGGLENPPVLVVCDMQRFMLVTNFTAAPQKIYEFTIAELEDDKKLGWLEAVFNAPTPHPLHPNLNAEDLTKQAARDFARLSEELGDTPEAAHFLIQIAFCLFVEDMGLLPRGMNGIAGFLTAIIADCQGDRATLFPDAARELFGLMARGGKLLTQRFPYFNGGLFEGDDFTIPDLQPKHMKTLAEAATRDWSAIEPSIFGTLFERGLDKSKRKQLGAHYTSREDIEALVKPVLMAPLEREWEAIQETLAAMPIPAPLPKPERRPASDLFENASRVDEPEPELEQAALDLMALRDDFLGKLRTIRVLDPACGSGNFLYVSLTLLKDLENRVIVHPAFDALPPAPPQVNPAQLYGIEKDSFAYELANAVVWIGYIQWHQRNRYMNALLKRSPILQRMDQNILHMDAILGIAEDGTRYKPEWPEVDVIVGNPPFLGGNKIRQELGDDTVDALFNLYDIPNFSDLCCYWFERAKEQIADGKAKRAGLLATQAIRGGANRTVLEKIKQTGDIFFAYSDRPWILEGATVRVSIVGFDGGQESVRVLDDMPVIEINPDLTADVNATDAQPLQENLDISFQGPSPKGPFDIPPELAEQMLNAPLNLNGRPNADVVKPVVNADDITKRSRGYWTIDFGTDLSLDNASLYEKPFEHLKSHVKPIRDSNRRAAYRNRWWLYAEARPGMRHAIQSLERYIATPRVSKYRVFVWLTGRTLPNDALIVFARDDDYFFGVLQSRAHEVWALRQGTQLREKESGNRYTPTTTFETFPLPWRPGEEPVDLTPNPSPTGEGNPHALWTAISEAARELNEKREAWLNPQSQNGVPIEAWKLKERTLTNLYNQKPEWLRLAHEKLDQAVFAAYGWEYPLEDEEILRRLLELNLRRAGAE